MKRIDISKLISEMVGGSAKPVTEEEMAEQFGHYHEGISGYVFLPSGDGYFVSDEENTKKGEK